MGFSSVIIFSFGMLSDASFANSSNFQKYAAVGQILDLSKSDPSLTVSL